MDIVIFSGTTEGRQLSEQLADEGIRTVVCVASEYGEAAQTFCSGIAVLRGPFTQEEKKALLQGAALCVDATHPYAAHVSSTVKSACAAAGIRYLRLLRSRCDVRDALEVENAAEAAAYLADREGNILLTTGARELPAFAGLEKERLYPRVLPSQESLRLCEETGIPKRNIIAMQGPFSKELNIALIRQFHIRFLVSKDGGIPGGFPEKAEAAAETGAELIVLRRPQEEGMTYAEVLRICRETAGRSREQKAETQG